MLFDHGLLAALKRHASRPALVDGDTRMDYRTLGERVARQAVALRKLGLAPGDRIAVLSTNSHRFMEVFLAAPLAGLVVAPVNPRLAPPEVAFIVNDSGARAMVVAPGCLPLYRACRAELKTVEHEILLAEEPAEGLRAFEPWIADADPGAMTPHTWREDDLLLLCYTGGTTGRPKGVMLSAGNVAANAAHAIGMAALRESDRWLHAAPMFHLADSWTGHALSSLGAFHVFMEVFEPGRALALIQAHGVSTTSIVPTMILRMLDVLEQERFDVSSFRRLTYGASPMPVERLEQAWRRFGPVMQQCYGQSESAPFLASIDPEDVAPLEPGGPLRRAASCGRAFDDVQLRIVDADDRPLPPGEVGEIAARGPNVMLGYWNRPEETQKTMRGGWLHTGDMAVMDEDGYLTIVDRAKDMIVTGAENVYSTEVENALYRHPAIQEAAVIGIPDDRWGEAVTAIVVLRPGRSATAEDIVAHCRTLIAAFKCPKHVKFLDTLPKSGAGKVLKADLRAPYWANQLRKVH
jgi:long-chain acyl-CoA synthetase